MSNFKDLKTGTVFWYEDCCYKKIDEAFGEYISTGWVYYMKPDTPITTLERNMTFEELEVVAQQYKIQLLRPEPGYLDEGGMSSIDTIWLHESEEWKQELSFWHELGHVLLNQETGQAMSTISREGAAWELGLIEAAKYSRHWEYHSKELGWARQCLASYIHGQYDDLPYKKNPRENNI